MASDSQISDIQRFLLDDADCGPSLLEYQQPCQQYVFGEDSPPKRSHKNQWDQSKAPKSHLISGEYIVVLDDNIQAESILSDYPLHVLRNTRNNTQNASPLLIYRDAISGFSCKLSRKELDWLNHDPRVKYIEQNRKIYLDPREMKGHKLAKRNIEGDQPAQQIPNGISRIGGLLSKTAKIDGKDERVDVDVAVIDTGIELDHPDLNVYRNVSFVQEAKTGDDDQGHGTHVAGTIAALDNDVGVVGVAPGARLWAVKVMDHNGSGTLADVIAGIDYVTQHADEIEVANISLGYEGYNRAFDESLTNSIAKGIVYVVAAGNSHQPSYKYMPGSNKDCITVTAFGDSNGKGGGGNQLTCAYDKDDVFAEFSNFDPRNNSTSPIMGVDLVAPGICVVSTWLGKSYESFSGTSMASPHVAGAAALYKVLHPKAMPKEVRDALVRAAKPQSDPNWGITGDPDDMHEPVLYVGDL